MVMVSPVAGTSFAGEPLMMGSPVCVCGTCMCVCVCEGDVCVCITILDVPMTLS